MLAASVMSAPAALAIAKLSYPETKKAKATSDIYNMPPRWATYVNIYGTSDFSSIVISNSISFSAFTPWI